MNNEGKFRVTYQVEFVSGNLVGIKTYLTIGYPMSSFDRVWNEFMNDILDRKVFGGPGSKYIILNFVTEKSA